MEKVYEKYKLILVGLGFVLLFLGILPTGARAATLYLSPSLGSYAVGSTVAVNVYVSSPEQAMNAASGVVSFPKDKLEALSLSKSASIFSLWVQEPDFSNTLGTINFEGIMLNPGFTGASGKILGITFRVKTTGISAITFSSGSVLANDGKGTEILTGLRGADFSLGVAGSVLPKTATPSKESGPLTAPEISSPTHPDPDKWCALSDAEFSWALPEGMDDVSYLINQKAESNPGPIGDGLKNSVKFTGVDDGIWYFHIKFGKSGKWGPIAHYKFQIDTIPPPILEITRDIDQNDPANPQVIIVFKSTDDSSGVDFYQMKIGKEDWFRIDKSLEGQPYELPMARISDFHDIGIKATDFAGNNTITEFDIDLIEKIFIKAPVKQGEPLELTGKAKPNKKLIISVSIAEAAKQMLGAQISSLPEEPGNYTKKIEKTADENGNWQVELSDLPSVKRILAVSLQDYYSILFLKTPTETIVSVGWFKIKNVSRGTILTGLIMIAILVIGPLVSLFELLKTNVRKTKYLKTKLKRYLKALKIFFK